MKEQIKKIVSTIGCLLMGLWGLALISGNVRIIPSFSYEATANNLGQVLILFAGIACLVAAHGWKQVWQTIKEKALVVAILVSVVIIFASATYAVNADIPVVSPILKAMFCRVDSEGVTQCFDREP